MRLAEKNKKHTKKKIIIRPKIIIKIIYIIINPNNKN